VWRVYDDSGRLLGISIDSNFDGLPDIEESYQNDVLVRREVDRNFDGSIDMVEDFETATGERWKQLIDVNFDGTADVLVLFQDGRPQFVQWVRPESAGGAAHAPSTPEIDNGLTRLVDPFHAASRVRSPHTRAGSHSYVSVRTIRGSLSLRPFSLTPRIHARRFRSVETPQGPIAVLSPRSPRGPPRSVA